MDYVHKVLLSGVEREIFFLCLSTDVHMLKRCGRRLQYFEKPRTHPNIRSAQSLSRLLNIYSEAYAR